MIETPTSRFLRRSLTVCSLAVSLTVGPLDAAAQGSWAFAPSAYTHNPATGARVTQYARHEPVEGLPDPRQTVSRYWRTRTNLRGADGSQDTIYEVRSFGNTLGGFDAQRERGFDAQLETLDALRPFRFNPYLFFGGMQGFGYGTPGYPAAVPGTPVPAPQGAFTNPNGTVAPSGGVQQGNCPNGDCQPAAPTPTPQPGLPGTAYPYAPPSSFVAPPFFAPPYGYFPYGYGYGGAVGGVPSGGRGGYPAPWWGYGPGRGSYVPGPDARRGF